MSKTKIIGSILFAVLISAGIIIGGMQTDAFKTGENYLINSKKIQQLFGEPLSVSGKWYGGHVSETGSKGNAKFGFNISGSKERGSAEVELDKDTTWNVTSVTLFFNNKKITLVNNSQKIYNGAK